MRFVNSPVLVGTFAALLPAISLACAADPPPPKPHPSPQAQALRGRMDTAEARLAAARAHVLQRKAAAEAAIEQYDLAIRDEEHARHAYNELTSLGTAEAAVRDYDEPARSAAARSAEYRALIAPLNDDNVQVWKDVWQRRRPVRAEPQRVEANLAPRIVLPQPPVTSPLLAYLHQVMPAPVDPQALHERPLGALDLLKDLTAEAERDPADLRDDDPRWDRARSDLESGIAYADGQDPQCAAEFGRMLESAERCRQFWHEFARSRAGDPVRAELYDRARAKQAKWESAAAEHQRTVRAVNDACAAAYRAQAELAKAHRDALEPRQEVARLRKQLSAVEQAEQPVTVTAAARR